MDVQPRILVVDDEEMLLRSIEKTLFRAGYDVETAANNVTAYESVLAALRTGKVFDLIIVDLNMPNFEGRDSKYAGLQLLERLKTEIPHTPIMVNSAWDEVETAKLCIEAGAADYFVKGRLTDMLEKIRAVLDISG
ncbi:MAG: response regulator [Chloroflexota bacterium]